MFSRTGTTSFDTITVKSDDPGLADFATTNVVQAASVTPGRLEQKWVVDWNGESSDFMAALGWNSAGEAQNPAFPEFSLVGFGDGQKKKSSDEISAETELEPADETAWYVEV